jgi:ATP-binding cassette subfamily B protein
MIIFKHLKDFVWKFKYKYLLGIIVLILVDALQLITPQVLKSFTDSITTNTTSNKDLFIYAGYILAIAALVALGRYYWRILIIAPSKEMEYWLRNRFFSHLVTLDQEFFNENKTGDLMAHATNDINSVRMAFGPGIVMAIDAIFMTLLTIFIMATNISLELTLVTLLPMPFIAYTVVKMGKAIQKKYDKVQEAFSGLSDKVQESFSGIRVIKSFSQEKYSLSSFNEINMINLKANINLVKLYGLMFPLITFISTISLIIGLGYGAKLVLEERITLGSFVAFITYIDLLTWPVMAIGYVINTFQGGMASLKRLNAILDTNSKLKNGIIDIPLGVPAISFKNLNFSYPNTKKEVIKSFNLDIEKGTSIGILGETGSGKTTIVSLLSRFYNVKRGTLFINGTDIMDINIESLRDNIGYVTQENFLFSESIRDNIYFSNPKNIDEDKLEKVTQKAMIKEEILSLPDGFSTLLGERGINLSGGQKQRTSIARALYKDPNILIFDDSLSAVDTKTEEGILSYLLNQIKDKTSIVISHRISTLKHLDKIIVIEGGTIAEIGSHEELLELAGLYSETNIKQMLEEKIQKEV